MNKELAELWKQQITKLLTDQNLIFTYVLKNEVNIQQDYQFQKAYIIDHLNDEYSIGLSINNHIMCGSTKWKIIPNTRTIQATTINIHNETILFAWTIDKNNKEYEKMFTHMTNAEIAISNFVHSQGFYVIDVY